MTLNGVSTVLRCSRGTIGQHLRSLLEFGTHLSSREGRSRKVVVLLLTVRKGWGCFKGLSVSWRFGHFSCTGVSQFFNLGTLAEPHIWYLWLHVLQKHVSSARFEIRELPVLVNYTIQARSGLRETLVFFKGIYSSTSAMSSTRWTIRGVISVPCLQVVRGHVSGICLGLSVEEKKFICSFNVRYALLPWLCTTQQGDFNTILLPLANPNEINTYPSFSKRETFFSI